MTIKKSTINVWDDLYISLCYAVAEGSFRQAIIESHTFKRKCKFIIDIESNHEKELNSIVCGGLNSNTWDLSELLKWKYL